MNWARNYTAVDREDVESKMELIQFFTGGVGVWQVNLLRDAARLSKLKMTEGRYRAEKRI